MTCVRSMNGKRVKQSMFYFKNENRKNRKK